MEEPTNGELSIMFKDLARRLDEGIEAILARLDITNGKVLKSDEFRLRNEDFIEEMKLEKNQTYRRFIDLAWKVGMVVVLVVLGWDKFFK